jgi:vancomycin resistance protein YoaR
MKVKLIMLFGVLSAVFCLSMCVTVDHEQEPVVEEPVIEVEAETPEPEQALETEAKEFVPSEELYTETFEDIQLIISNLNTVISSKDYEIWLTYLTSDYIGFYSASEQFERYTEMLKQRGRNTRISSLKDYFLYLVVISRANAVVDEIVFLDKTHIKALTEIKGKLSVLYYLEKLENSWKIGLKPEN